MTNHRIAHCLRPESPFVKLALVDKSKAIAIGAILLLVAQTVLWGLAAGAMAAPTALDAFGNPLCINEPSSSDGEANPGHDGIPDCCTTGCLKSTALLPEPEQQHSRAERIETKRAHAAGAPAAPVSNRKHDPAKPRAPPHLS